MENLNKDADFLVKECRNINYFFGFLMLAVFFAAAIILDVDWFHYIYGLALFLFPAAFFIARGRKNKIVMIINSSGFYYHDELITDWEHFESAKVVHSEIPGAINDNFVLLLTYYSPDGRLFRSRIKLTNTQDKAEEEIIEAIDFYYKADRRDLVQSQYL